MIKSSGNPTVGRDQKRFIIEGITVVPGGTETEDFEREHGVHIYLKDIKTLELEESLEDFLNHPLTDTFLTQVKKIIVDYYRDNLNEYVAVIIPLQKILNGVVFFQVLEGSIGETEYTGQKWFSKNSLARSIGIKPGDPLIESEFVNNVTWSNRNPFRNTQIILIPGETPGYTDIQFMTKDRFPARFFTGADNTGFLITGENRLFAGVNIGNAFGIGDLFSYQYTTSTDFTKFQSHVLNYTSFLPWHHIFNALGVYGVVKPDILGFSVEGKNLQGSLRYQIPFEPFFGSFRHHVELGFDYKYITSNLFFLGDVSQSALSIDTIVVAEITGSYSLQKNYLDSLLSFRADMVVSPVKNVFPYQNQADYDSLREGSNVRYIYWKTAASCLTEFLFQKKKFTFSALFRGQVASGALPTSEQFGLGGINTVRGYYEQQFVADDALCANLELYFPSFSLVKQFKNTLAFLVFLDYGYGYNYVAVEPAFIAQNLLGIGPGARYEILSNLNARFDYGVQILDIEGDHKFGRFHFSVNASY